MKRIANKLSILLLYFLVLSTPSLNCASLFVALQLLNTWAIVKNTPPSVEKDKQLRKIEAIMSVFWRVEKTPHEEKVDALKNDINNLNNALTYNQEKKSNLTQEIAYQKSEKRHVEEKLHQSEYEKQRLRKAYFRCVNKWGKEQCQRSSRLFDSD